ncbi:hypothetical protein SKAU_G00305270 [Synaphobranchus kaupii]|uniref:Uncharacterized protein n=1 Tax=Synaphobranchus kaupii TaxID=118154 RepID=A0A9Q1IKH5_SYNKA|nr:hypothetical protein SKAU_G00305270 [Synaphobranchus kaupii]
MRAAAREEVWWRETQLSLATRRGLDQGANHRRAVANEGQSQLQTDTEPASPACCHRPEMEHTLAGENMQTHRVNGKRITAAMDPSAVAIGDRASTADGLGG